jgi:hypothetical protein
LTTILSPTHFVKVRNTPGGPAPVETQRAIGVSQQSLDADVAWLKETRARHDRAQQELRERCARL